MSKWCIYLLRSGNRTYIGSTTDVHRRLRQHNGEIRGGARATRGRKWQIACYISGFENRSVACRWERILKHRRRGLRARAIGMLEISMRWCPMSGDRYKYYEVPSGLTFIEESVEIIIVPRGVDPDTIVDGQENGASTIEANQDGEYV